MNTQSSKTIIFYTTPAHGHINPALPIMSALIEKGYTVIAYSTDEFKEIIESSGAEFRRYVLGSIRFRTSIGSDLMPLTDLILRFTRFALPRLITEAQCVDPVLILHDTLALWGRMTADALGTPAASINTIQTVYSVHSNTFKLYTRNFAASTFSKLYKFGEIDEGRNALQNLYGLEKTDLLSLLMNKEKFNIFTFPRCMHPDGEQLGQDCFFVGATSRLRSVNSGDMIDCDNLIYVSLGTVFNKSMAFYHNLIKEFGGTPYNLLVSCGDNYGRLSRINTPDNIVLTPFANQGAALASAKLFITAGGMNSLCEAVAAGVPCLMVPQQGEQMANAEMMELIGAGIRSHGLLYEEGSHMISAFRRNDKLIDIFSNVRIDLLISTLEDYMKRV